MLAELKAGQVKVCCALRSAVERSSCERCEVGDGGDASRDLALCLSVNATPHHGDGPLPPLTPPPSPCPHATVSSSRDEKRKPPEFAGKVAFEAYLHQVVMAKIKSGDEREKLAESNEWWL